MHQAPAGSPPENNERDVNQLYEKFLAEVAAPLKTVIETLNKPASTISDNEVMRTIGSLVGRVTSRIGARVTRELTLSERLTDIYEHTVEFLKTLSDVELLRLADQRKWLIHYNTTGKGATRLDTATVYLQDIPKPTATGVPADNYLSAVAVVYQYPFPYPKDISGVDTGDGMIRKFPDINAPHYALNELSRQCREKEKRTAFALAYAANQLIPEASGDRLEKLQVAANEAEIVGTLDDRDDVFAFDYQRIITQSLGYQAPDMERFKTEIAQVHDRNLARLVLVASAAGINAQGLSAHVPTQAGGTAYRRGGR